MKRSVIPGVFLWGLVLTGFAAAQTQGQVQAPSLGELARKLRAERAQEGSKPAKLYTNDDLSRGGEISTTESRAAGEQPSTEATGSTKAKTARAEHNEAYYRKQMDELRDRKNMHQRELAVLQQKISQGEMQYYADPNQTLLQTSTPKVNSDVNKLRDDINKKKQQITDDDKAISDLEHQCQEEGCPPGWLR